MDIRKEDIEKVNFITIAAQTNDLVSILMTMDKAALQRIIESVEPKFRNGIYKFMPHVLTFHNAIESEIVTAHQKEKDKKEQGELFQNE